MLGGGGQAGRWDARWGVSGSGGAFLSGGVTKLVMPGPGSGSSQPYLGPRGAGAAPATR
jgi:hypothetical protein